MSTNSEKPPAFFAFWPDRWLGGTSGWSAEEKGCYISLLVHQFVHGSLPDDMGRLARICGCPTKEAFEQIWDDVLRDKFDQGSDGLVNARMEEERTRSIAKSNACRANGRKGGRPRKSQQKPSALAPGDPSVKTPQTQTQTQNQHPSPSYNGGDLLLDTLTSNKQVLAAAEKWRHYRREARLDPWTATTWRKNFAWAEQSPQEFIDAVENSIKQGYRGLVQPKAAKGDTLSPALQALKRWHDDAN